MVINWSSQTWSLIGGNTLRGGSRAMKSWMWVWPVELKSGRSGLVVACTDDSG